MLRMLALSLVVLFAPAAGAQVPLGAAIAQAKAGLKAALAQEKAALAEVEAQLGAAIDTLATAAQAGPLTTELLEGVLPTWLAGMEDLGAAVVAALNLIRPSPVLLVPALALACFGVVLYNANLAALAVALLVLSLARRAPEPE